MILLCFAICFTGCSNTTGTEGNAGDPYPNATFESVEEVRNLVTAAKEGEEAFQTYKENLPGSNYKLNIFWEAKDVVTFEEYVKCTEFPVLSEAAMTKLERMEIDYSSWRNRLFDCIYYIDGIQYRFMYYKSSTMDDFPDVEKEVQLDHISFGMYKNEENGWYQGHTMIGEYFVAIRVGTLEIDSITFEHFTLEKILD